MMKIEVAAGAQPTARLRRIAQFSMHSEHINFFICAIWHAVSIAAGGFTLV